MSLIRLDNVTKTYNTRTVLSDISFTIEKGQKIGLAGYNGTGKTTILKILAGKEEIDGGNISFAPDISIAYITQEVLIEGNQTIREYIEGSVGNVDQYKIETMLEGFGLDVSFERKINTLSGGQKTKILLSSALLKNPDIFLFDEPTNNLDLPALLWLEEYIKQSEACCVIVSHDVKFLDGVVNKILEIEWDTKNIRITSGNYSDYIALKERERENTKKKFEVQQKHIERLEDAIIEKKADALAGSKWEGTDNDKMQRGFNREHSAGSSKRAKVIEKRLEMMEKIEEEMVREPLSIYIESDTFKKDCSITLTEAVLGYDSFSIGPISLSIRYGNRIGIMGLNGSGKSTLLKAITGYSLPLRGEVKCGSGVRFGNLMQEHESLPREEKVFDFFSLKSGLDEEHVYSELSKFGFTVEHIRHTIGDLSPGERTRLLLALFAVLKVNTLILDEPTNHLDIEALSALEESIKEYTGTVILVSHDRFFIEKSTLDDMYILQEGVLKKLENYKDYITRIEKEVKNLLKKL